MNTTTPYLNKAIASARGPKQQISTEEIEEKFRRLGEIETSLLPIEAVSREQLKNRRQELQKEIKKIAAQNATETEIARLPYPIIDKSVFGLRNAKGFPCLAPFSLNDSNCIISSLGRHTMPASVAALYEDVKSRLGRHSTPKEYAVIGLVLLSFFLLIEKILIGGILAENLALGSRIFLIAISILAAGGIASIPTIILLAITGGFFGVLKRGGSVEYLISAKFEGVIPASVRTIIRKAVDSKNFQEVFILAEVPEWKITTRPAPRPIAHGDPLVVGYDGKHMRLIHAFDTTSFEQYIAEEFVVKSDS